MNMVVTNLRLPEDEYLTLKALASEEKLSFNEYVRKSLVGMPVVTQFGKSKSKKPKKDIYQALLELAKKGCEGEGMGLSGEDEIIYGD